MESTSSSSALLGVKQTARMGRTGGGNGSPPAAPATPPARGGNGAAFAQQQQQQQQHAVSGRARHAMVVLPIALATFALVLQVWMLSMISANAGAIQWNMGCNFGQCMLLRDHSMRAMGFTCTTVSCCRAVLHARCGAAPADAARF